jgi:serine protease Do
MKLRWSSRLLGGLTVLCLFVAGSSSISAAESKAEVKWDTNRATVPEDLDEIKALQERVKKVVEKCSPCTVGILIGFGAGSGVIVSEDGLVLTAAHVLTGEESPGKLATYESGRTCMVVLPDGKKVKAKTLGVNADSDSGMVQITDKGPNDGKWPFLPIAKSSDLKKGQWVVSLGHPGGPKEGRPPVARLGRIERTSKENVTSNCTLVGGDSGGPLFDLDGNVIGIHTRIFFSLSMNYHIPTEQFKTQWDKLIAGEVFGYVAKKPPPAEAPRVGVIFPDEENDDAWIVDVDEDGPAHKAGLKKGDTVTKINGVSVKSVKDFRTRIASRKPDETVTLTVRRSTEILTLRVKLTKMESR